MSQKLNEIRTNAGHVYTAWDHPYVTSLQDAKEGTHRLDSPAGGSSCSYRTKALMTGPLISFGASMQRRLINNCGKWFKRNALDFNLVLAVIPSWEPRQSPRSQRLCVTKWGAHTHFRSSPVISFWLRIQKQFSCQLIHAKKYDLIFSQDNETNNSYQKHKLFSCEMM